MKSTYTFQLIEGNFSSAECREILLNVFSSKIQFHQMKNFNLQERFGKEDTVALKRIYELKKSIDEIIKLLDIADNNGEQIEIQSKIVLGISKATKNV